MIVSWCFILWFSLQRQAKDVCEGLDAIRRVSCPLRVLMSNNHARRDLELGVTAHNRARAADYDCCLHVYCGIVYLGVKGQLMLPQAIEPLGHSVSKLPYGSLKEKERVNRVICIQGI